MINWMRGDKAVLGADPNNIVEILGFGSNPFFAMVRDRFNEDFSAYVNMLTPWPAATPAPPEPTAHVWKPGDKAIFDGDPKDIVEIVGWDTDPKFVIVGNSRNQNYYAYVNLLTPLPVAPPPAPTAHHDGQANLSGVPLTLEAAAFDLVPARPASPTLADTLQGIGSWHLANHRAARLDIHLTGHVVGLTLTPIDGRPNRTVKFHAGQSPAFVVGVLDRALALNPENRL